MRSLPPLTWFRAFDSAARHLSFTAAAEELGLTQSAISQHVRALEQRLGTALFIRKHRGLALTDEGRRLVPDVAGAMATLSAATEGFEPKQERGVLSVATSVSIAQWILVPGLRRFTEATGVAVRLATKVWPDEFSGGIADVEIRFDSPASAGRKAELLAESAMVVVGAPEMANAPVMAQPLIQVVGTSDSWQAWARHRGAAGTLTPAAYVESHGMAVDLAVAGFGVALTSAIIAAPALRDGRLIRLEQDTIPARDGYYVRITENANSALSQQFVEWVRGEIAR